MYGDLLLKGTHPFVYLSLTLDPRAVDVNVHPTKSEVKFLYEREIAELMAEAVKDLLSLSRSKVHQVPTIVPPPLNNGPRTTSRAERGEGLSGGRVR